MKEVRAFLAKRKSHVLPCGECCVRSAPLKKTMAWTLPPCCLIFRSAEFCHKGEWMFFCLFPAPNRVILESDPQQVVHRVALRVSSPPLPFFQKYPTQFGVVSVNFKPNITVPTGGWCAFDGADSHSGEQHNSVFYLRCKSFNSSISLLTVKTHHDRTCDDKGIVTAPLSLSSFLLCHSPPGCHILRCLLCMTEHMIGNYLVVRWSVANGASCLFSLS